MKYLPYGFDQESYGAILVAAGRDKYDHNQIFANEIAAAFEAEGVRTKQVDYIQQVRLLSECYPDPHCKFFVCFNGFGSELSLASGALDLQSAFAYYKKPLLDLMHDCPLHETMAHQAESKGPWRNLLLTDYNHAFLARLLGTGSVRFVPGITFPASLGRGPAKPFAERSIDVLLPIGLSSAEAVRGRHAHAGSHRDRVYKEIFESVVSRAVADLRVDPLVEAIVALREIDASVRFASPEVTLLISSILDYVKFQRRRDLVDAIKHLPLTVITDHDLNAEFPGTALRGRPGGPFAELLQTMSDSRCVVCPLPHHTGFHERAMGAFTAGAYVVAAPNEILETSFAHRREMMTYRDARELALLLERILAGADIEEAAVAGRRKAMESFSPGSLVSTMLTSLALQAHGAP